MCFVWTWEQTAIISLYNINWLVFIPQTMWVYCAVRTGSSYNSGSSNCLKPNTTPKRCMGEWRIPPPFNLGITCKTLDSFKFRPTYLPRKKKLLAVDSLKWWMGCRRRCGGGSHESAENEPPAVLSALTPWSRRDLVHVQETSLGIQRSRSL